ncbi:hypothetical protein PBY51_019744 [Eleginops maclovinus]|uniref:PLEKHM2 PH domain-containing protein n=1 Tax=Eleginops maclovinus TaxID=56733 RepID=A0AAN7XR26_ELEMC|nr:hypothetical protein PBY51_019744 [Eleginops maclovinus]
MKDVVSQYVTMMSKELPLINRMQLNPEPEPCVVAKENKVSLVDLSKDCALRLSQRCGMSTIPGVSELPEGSVSSLKDQCPEVYYQKLVQLPSALSELQSFTSQKMLDKLESLSPQKVNKLLSIFWLEAANSKQPIPKPGCLLLTKKEIIVLSSEANSEDPITIHHHLNLLEIKKVQISLAGQHARLIDSTEDTILVVFTHSRELTQEFCKALLKVLSQGEFSEEAEDHPLLSGDLMVLSLDWTSNIPDIV